MLYMIMYFLKRIYYNVNKEGTYPTKNTMKFILISLAMSHEVKAFLQIS